MAIDMAVLATALQAPAYSGLSDGDAATLINSPTGPHAATIDVALVTNAEMQQAVVGSEYLLLSAVQRALWDVLLGLGKVPVKNTRIRGQVADVWGALTTTRANLLALQTRTGSHAEVLFGDGTSIDFMTVNKARGGS